mgnify:CR=1 FL=1
MPYRTMLLTNLTQSKSFQTDVKLRHVEVLFYIFVALPIEWDKNKWWNPVELHVVSQIPAHSIALQGHTDK